MMHRFRITVNATQWPTAGNYLFEAHNVSQLPRLAALEQVEMPLTCRGAHKGRPYTTEQRDGNNGASHRTT